MSEPNLYYHSHRAEMIAASAADTREHIDLGDSVAAYATEALRFAFYPQIADAPPVYPALAMLGEIGELAEKVLAYMNTPAPLTGTLDTSVRYVIKELGDVLWYVAAAARDFGFSLTAVVGVETWDAFNFDFRFTGSVEEDVLGLMAAAGKVAEHHVKKPWRDGGRANYVEIGRDLRAVVCCMAQVANAYGWTLGQVAQANIDKLVARRKRGTLTGSGDNR